MDKDVLETMRSIWRQSIPELPDDIAEVLMEENETYFTGIFNQVVALEDKSVDQLFEILGGEIRANELNPQLGKEWVVRALDRLTTAEIPPETHEMTSMFFNDGFIGSAFRDLITTPQNSLVNDPIHILPASNMFVMKSFQALPADAWLQSKNLSRILELASMGFTTMNFSAGSEEMPKFSSYSAHIRCALPLAEHIFLRGLTSPSLLGDDRGETEKYRKTLADFKRQGETDLWVSGFDSDASLLQNSDELSTLNIYCMLRDRFKSFETLADAFNAAGKPHLGVIAGNFKVKSDVVRAALIKDVQDHMICPPQP